MTTTFKNRIPLTILILGILGAGSDLAMPPRVADPAQTSEQTLVKKYLGGGVVEVGAREGGSGGCTEPPGNEYYRWLVVEILAVWSRSLHSFLKEQVREFVSHSVVYYELPWDTSSYKSIVHLVVLK